MPFLDDLPQNERKVVEDTIFGSTAPLRLIALAFVLSSLSPLLALPWQTTTSIFNWIAFPMIANIGFIAFGERKFLKQMGKLQWICWIVTLSMGVISIEFTGIAVHTATIFMQNSATATFWDHVSIFLFGGSFALSIFQSYTKRFTGKQMDDRIGILFIIVITVLLVALSWIVFTRIIPHDFMNMMIINFRN